MNSVFIYFIILLGWLGLFFGIGLAVAAKNFYVTVNHKIEEIVEVLPGANYGACGYPGCSAYAHAVAAGCSGYVKAVVEGKVDIDKCISGGREVHEKIAVIMGLSVGNASEAKVAVVQCVGISPKLTKMSGEKK